MQESHGKPACGGQVATHAKSATSDIRMLANAPPQRRATPADPQPANAPLAFAPRQVHDGRTDPQRRGRPHGPGTDRDPPDGRPRRRRPASGKTTLAEALLHRAGAIPSAGSVEQGTTVCDHEPEEIARGTSLGLSLAHLTWTGEAPTRRRRRVTHHPGRHPGPPGLRRRRRHRAGGGGCRAGRRERGRRGHGGHAVRVGARPRRRAAAHRRRRRRRTRRAPTSGACWASCGRRSASELWPLELPLGEEQAFHGVADVLSEQALDYDDDGPPPRRPMPADAEAEEHRLHVEVTEEIVSHDDDQLEAYLDGQRAVAPTELERTLAHEVATGEAVPGARRARASPARASTASPTCSASSRPAPARHDSRIVVGGTRTARRRGRASRTEPRRRDRSCTSSAPWPTRSSARSTMFKVLSGTVQPGDRLRNTTTGTEERIPALFRLRGKPSTCRSTRCAPARSARSPSSRARRRASLLWSRAHGTARPRRLPHREPGVRGEPRPRRPSPTTTKLSAALARLVAEDPTLVIDRAGRRRPSCAGSATPTSRSRVERLARVFGVHVTTAPAPVAYRETIAGSRARPRASSRSSRAATASSPWCSCGSRRCRRAAGSSSSTRSWAARCRARTSRPSRRAPATRSRPAARRGIRSSTCASSCYDGKSHSVDSSEMAFRTAASIGRARRRSPRRAPCVLEPVSIVTVTVPADLQGTVLTDLSARRGRVSATEIGRRRPRAHRRERARGRARAATCSTCAR